MEQEYNNEHSKLVDFIKEKYDKTTILKAYLDYVDPDDWIVENVMFKGDFNYFLELFIKSCEYMHSDIIVVIEHYIEQNY